MKELREFVRHPVDVPIEVTTVTTAPSSLMNVSYGGLAFIFEEPLEIDRIIHLRVPSVEPVFETDGRVVWCRPHEAKYMVGVVFVNSTEAFQSRMVQQVIAIENYRREVARKDGRRLTPQEAAAEWTRQVADRFRQE